MNESVARPDDGVHLFFASVTKRLVTDLLQEHFLETLLGLFARGHRERRFNLATMLWLGIFGAAHASMRSMEAILAAARDAVEGLSEVPLHARTLSQSGWSRAKARMPLGLLKHVWRRWVALARSNGGEAAWFHDLRLVALDKKTLRVPEALWTTFGSHGGTRHAGPAQGELVVAYDVGVRVPLELTLGRAGTNERPLASRVLRKLCEASLLLIDAGFYSIGLFADVRGAGHHFLTVMRSSGRPKLLRRLGPHDGLYEIRASAYWKKKDPTVPATMTVRIVWVRRKGFRPRRLVTSLLDPQAVPPSDLAELYHRRWHIETFFRELSSDLEFEHWHTRQLKVLYVELLFCMLYVTVVRAYMAEAARDAGVLAGALSFARGAQACLRSWSRSAKAPPLRRAALHKELIRYLATLRIDVRPGRRFQRDTQKRRRKSRHRKLQALRSKADVA